MSRHYFAADGSYGSADGLIVIDTTDWDSDDWEVVEQVSDSQRSRVARDLASAPWVDQQLVLFES